MRKLTKSDLQTLAETMPVIPVDEQRGYLAMGSYGPEPSGIYYSEEDIANFRSGLNVLEAYKNDCVFATAAFANIGGTNDQAEINKLAEEWVLSNNDLKPKLQEYINQGMNSEEAAKAYLKNNYGGAEMTQDEVIKYYNANLKQTGVTLMVTNSIGNKTCHWMLVAGYDSETGTFNLFDGSKSATSYEGNGRTPTITIQEMIDEGTDFTVWCGTKRWGTLNGVMGSWTPGAVFTPYGNDSSSGSSSSDEYGSSDSGSSGSSGDNPWYPGNSSGY